MATSTASRKGRYQRQRLGVAAVLETAVQLGSEPAVNNAVRFGFWGPGSRHRRVEEVRQVAQRRPAQRHCAVSQFRHARLAEPRLFHLRRQPVDGAAERHRTAAGAGGIRRIERTFVDYLKSVGKAAEDTGFDGRSDYDGFTMAGIPGGLFSGAEEEKSPQQAGLWGWYTERIVRPELPQGHRHPRPIDRTALGINGGGVAWAVGVYAQDLSGRNGIPAREDRTRHVIGDR